MERQITIQDVTRAFMVSGVDRARHKRQMHHWALGRVRFLAKTMNPEEVAADTSLPLINVKALGKEVWENRAQHLYIRGVSLDEIERQTGIRVASASSKHLQGEPDHET